MYTSALQLSQFYDTPVSIRCIITIHLWNGFADAIEIDKDTIFYEKQKAKLIKDFGFTLAEAEKMIKFTLNIDATIYEKEQDKE